MQRKAGITIRADIADTAPVVIAAAAQLLAEAQNHKRLARLHRERARLCMEALSALELVGVTFESEAGVTHGSHVGHPNHSI